MPKSKTDYECSNCSAIFQSGAKPGNVRHQCGDGKTGVGKDVDYELKESERDLRIAKKVNKELTEGDVELVKNTKDVVDVKDVEVVEEIPGDIEFTLEDDVEIEGEELDLGAMPGLPPKEEKRRPSKPTKKTDRNKIQSFIRGIYAMTGNVDLSPDEEAEILADIWAGVGEVHVDTPQIHVGGGMYMIMAGVVTLGLMGRRQLGAYTQAKAYKAATKPPPKPLEPHEGW